MQMSTLQKAKLGVVVRATTLCALFMGLFFWGTQVLFSFEQTIFYESVKAEESSDVRSLQNILSGVYDHIAIDLALLRENAALQAIVNDEGSFEANKAAFIQYLLIFVSKHPNMLQVRYIQLDGQEVVRVDQRDGKIKVIPEDELQNKSKRYYFEEGIRAEKDKIYVSPFDLNIEHGKIETPLTPTLRFVTPVFDQFGVKKGVVAINLLGDSILNKLRQAEEVFDVTLLLVNDQGHWIKGFSALDDWDWIYTDHNPPFSARFPDEWERIAEKQNGVYISEQGLFAYTRIGLIDPSLSEVNHSSVQNPGYGWELISYTPETFLNARLAEIREKYQLLNLIAFVIFPVIAFVFARVRISLLKSEAVVQQQQEKISSIVDFSFDPIITIDAQAKITFFNPAACKLFGYAASEVLGQNVKMLIHGPDKARHDGYVQHRVESGVSNVEGLRREVQGITKDGKILQLDLCVTSIKDSDGVWQFIGMLRDISVAVAKREKLETEVLSDKLTGVWNRRAFDIEIKKEFSRSVRENTEFSVLFIDIDHFKKVNDTYGHSAGDQVLSNVAKLIVSMLRASDSVFRYGGEEFVVVLPASDQQEAQLVAERIRMLVAGTPTSTDEGLIHCTVSVGIASRTAIDGGSIDQIIEAADNALYRAKEEGRNRVCLA